MSADKIVHIVEDDPAVADSLREYFHATGYDVITYEDGGSFLDTASLHDHDTVIIDLALPDMNGANVYEWIRDNYRTVFPIIVTGQSRHQIQEMTGGDNGIGPVFRKPLKIDQLLDVMERKTDADRSDNGLRAI